MAVRINIHFISDLISAPVGRRIKQMELFSLFFFFLCNMVVCTILALSKILFVASARIHLRRGCFTRLFLLEGQGELKWPELVTFNRFVLLRVEQWFREALFHR